MLGNLLTFLVVYTPFAVGGTVLLIPAFFFTRKQSKKGCWLLPFIHVPPILVLYWLVSVGFGRPQSLGNLIEFPILCGVSVAAAYLKVFGIDRIYNKPLWTTYLFTGLLIGFAFVLRLVMPTMPE